MKEKNIKVANKYMKHIKEENKYDNDYDVGYDTESENLDLDTEGRYEFPEKYFNICKRLELGEDVPLEDINFVLEEIIRVSEKNEAETK